ncbi:MAG: hypothetical protein V3S49_01420 [Thermodesulfobacteriota bacterium]
MPTTITISQSTKELLENVKGAKKWDALLRDLAEEYVKFKRRRVRRELKKLLIEETRVKGWAREY